jgi:hypothetical protein
VPQLLAFFLLLGVPGLLVLSVIVMDRIDDFWRRRY